jgi:hypothetical protein
MNEVLIEDSETGVGMGSRGVGEGDGDRWPRRPARGANA